MCEIPRLCGCQEFNKIIKGLAILSDFESCSFTVHYLNTLALECYARVDCLHAILLGQVVKRVVWCVKFKFKFKRLILHAFFFIFDFHILRRISRRIRAYTPDTRNQLFRAYFTYGFYLDAPLISFGL